MSVDAKKWPALKEAWEEYGHGVKWEDLHGAKTDGRNCYVVVCWRTPEGNLALADLARTSIGGKWEFQNDGMSPDITDAEWAKVKIEPDCDNFYIPGHAEYKSWGGRG